MGQGAQGQEGSRGRLCRVCELYRGMGLCSAGNGEPWEVEEHEGGKVRCLYGSGYASLLQLFEKCSPTGQLLPHETFMQQMFIQFLSRSP